MGWAAWLGLHSDENSTIVNSLLQAGAVIHTRTSLSQGAWFSEGDNHVYGRTDNPYNRDLVPGVSLRLPFWERNVSLTLQGIVVHRVARQEKVRSLQ